jgi:hypothetical protein
MIRIHTNGRIGVLSPVFTELFLFAAGVRFVPGAVTLAFAMLKDTCLVSVVPVAFQLLPSYCCCAKATFSV